VLIHCEIYSALINNKTLGRRRNKIEWWTTIRNKTTQKNLPLDNLDKYNFVKLLGGYQNTRKVIEERLKYKITKALFGRPPTNNNNDLNKNRYRISVVNFYPTTSPKITRPANITTKTSK